MSSQIFYLLVKKFNLESRTAQICFLTVNAIGGLVLLPFIIYGSLKKYFKILNPKVNGSYSMISLWSLYWIIFSSILNILRCIFIFSFCLYAQQLFATTDEFEKCLNFKKHWSAVCVTYRKIDKWYKCIDYTAGETYWIIM